MTLVERVQGIIMKPKETWPAVLAESETTQSLYTSVIVPLAAIPAVCTFIGFTFVGVPIPFYGMYRYSLVGGLTQAVIAFIVSLVAVYVIAMIADALAPSFSGTKNQMAALKLVTYSLVPSWLAGVFLLMPAVMFLRIAGLYGFYLLYLGVGPSMNVPADKTVGYTIVLAILASIATVILFICGSILGSMVSPISMTHY
jgi:hypothetical protein